MNKTFILRKKIDQIQIDYFGKGRLDSKLPFRGFGYMNNFKKTTEKKEYKLKTQMIKHLYFLSLIKIDKKCREIL